MRDAKIWRLLAGVETAIVEGTYMDEDEQAMVVEVRPRKRDVNRCPLCGRRSPRFDRGGGKRRWRALDLGFVPLFIEADAPRIHCKEHGVVVAYVPWARHRSRCTRDFEDQVAWLVTHTDKTTVSELMRVAWRTVGAIVDRVAAEERVLSKPLANLRRIGIDEVSYRRGQKYLTIVVDHDSGRVVWVRPGRDEATVNAFLDELGEEGCHRIELVSADAAAWIRGPVQNRCPDATICMDPFHVIQWATDALDEVRRTLWQDARARGQRVLARLFKAGRYALWKSPENLTDRQHTRLSEVAKTSEPLYRAYLMKESLREVFRLKGELGGALLDEWLAWASRSRLRPFVELARKIRRHLEHIHAVLEHRLSNALVESCNTKVRLLTRMAFGFHSPEPLAGLIMLRLGKLCPPLPGRW